MAKISLNEFYDILHKPMELCNGYDLHLQRCWKENRSSSIFYLTGLDVSGMLGKEDENPIKNPSIRGKVIIVPPID